METSPAPVVVPSLGEGDGCDTFKDVRQCNAIYALRTALATFSLFGWYRNFGQRMIMFLSIAACLDTFPYLFGRRHEITPVCQFQAFWMTWFDWAVLSWTPVWGAPTAPGGVPEVPTIRLWCWIVNKSWLRFGLWYIPLLCAIVSLFAANGYIYLKVRNMSKQFQGTYNPEIEAQKQFLRKQVQPLKLYPFVYLCVSIFPFVNRVQNWVSFLNALIYASNTDKGFWNQCNVTNLRRAFTLGKGRGGVYVFDQGDGMEDGIINGTMGT
eukprot:gene14716-34965_t